MDKKTKKAFEAVVKGLGLTDADICKWLMERDSFLVPTELPVVYAEGTELTIKHGLDLNLKDKVWGIQLSSGVILAGDFLGTNADGKPYSGAEIMELAKSYTLNGKTGSVPHSLYFEKLKLKREWILYQKTIHTLDQYCDSCLPFFWGVVWTATNHYNENYLRFDLTRVERERGWGVGYLNNWYISSARFEKARLALCF